MPATVKDLMTALAACEPGARVVARHGGRDLDLHAVVNDGELRDHFAKLMFVEDDGETPAVDAAYSAGKARMATAVLSAVIQYADLVADETRAVLELAETRARLLTWLGDLGVTEDWKRIHLADLVDRIRKELGK